MAPTYDIVPRLTLAWQASGLSKAALAQKAGIRWAQIHKLLTGQRPHVSAETVRRLALALGCTTDYLLGMEEETHAVSVSRHRCGRCHHDFRLPLAHTPDGELRCRKCWAAVFPGMAYPLGEEDEWGVVAMTGEMHAMFLRMAAGEEALRKAQEGTP